MEKDFDYSVYSDFEAAPRTGRAAVHRVFNIAFALLATVAFAFSAIFGVIMIDAFIKSENFNGEGINGDAIGFALAFVLMLVADAFVLPLSTAGAVLSFTTVKFRSGKDRITGKITLALNLAYIILSLALFAAGVMLGN